ncbi:MAG: hypothetical protein EBR12_07370 [Proteobacteria bacterium]|nr:hypothetical protein [Pseudomonadota bacterium]
MTSSLSISEFLETARQKLGGVSSCLNNSKAFARAVTEFDDWLEGQRETLSHAADLDYHAREEVADILRQLSRLELQARHNASLVSDMQKYLHPDSAMPSYATQTPEATADTQHTADEGANLPAEDNLRPASDFPPGLGLRSPAAQIYARQNQAIEQAGQK